MSQELEQEKCEETHHAGCACHEQGWQNKYQVAVDMAARAQIKSAWREELLINAARLAEELIMAIWVNNANGGFKSATPEQLKDWLRPRIERLQAIERKINEQTEKMGNDE
jgi:hypothetical protein